MRYLLLLTNDADEIEAWTRLDAEGRRRAHEAEVPRWEPFFRRMEDGRHLVSGLELDVPASAKTVRVVDGEAIVLDGPFAETREQVGGYFVVDCASLDEAIELAALVPVARTGSVEIRPLEAREEAR